VRRVGKRWVIAYQNPEVIIPDDMPILLDKKGDKWGWVMYTPEQCIAVCHLVEDIVIQTANKFYYGDGQKIDWTLRSSVWNRRDGYANMPDIERCMIMHSDLDPTRRSDPGPVFPRWAVRDGLDAAQKRDAV
jgi:hypothetical protein